MQKESTSFPDSGGSLSVLCSLGAGLRCLSFHHSCIARVASHSCNGTPSTAIRINWSSLFHSDYTTGQISLYAFMKTLVQQKHWKQEARRQVPQAIGRCSIYWYLHSSGASQTSQQHLHHFPSLTSYCSPGIAKMVNITGKIL